MIDGKAIVGVPLPVEDIATCKLILQTFLEWEELYTKQPSPFTTNLSEAYWGRKSWPILLGLVHVLEGIFMLDGEKIGLDSSKRKNEGRQWTPDSKVPRKRVGRKLDLIARDMIELKDWLVVERMKEWDEFSNKFLKESGCDLIRETHTIMRNRLQDAKNTQFRQEACFFGIYTGDRGFQTFQLRAVPTSPYISVYKLYSVYDLPPRLLDMKENVQAITHLLQLRQSMICTIEAHRRAEPESDEDWIYGDSLDGRKIENTIASSPIASPCPSDHLEPDTCLPSDESFGPVEDQMEEEEDTNLDSLLYSD